MKRLLLAIIFLFAYSQLCHAQKGIAKLTRYKIDSLQHLHVDTILHYCSYCGECEVLGRKRNCYLASGYTLTENLIIYQQQGKFYLLDFDCSNTIIKKQLDSSKSIPYFISIIPTLDARDKAIKLIYKKRNFLPPIITDGSSATAEIYDNRKRQYASINLDMSQDLMEAWDHYFWFKNEVNLFKLIKTDLDKGNIN